MAKVFIVTVGEYSSQGNWGVYSTLELAQEAKELANSLNDIEEFEVDFMPDHPQGMVCWCIVLTEQGEVLNQYRLPPSDEDWHPCCGMPGEAPGVRFYVWAKDNKQAIKAANERRAQLIALNLWTTDWHKWNSDPKIQASLRKGPYVAEDGR